MKMLVIFCFCALAAYAASRIGTLGFFEYFFYVSLGSATTDPIWARMHTGSVWGN